MTGTSKANNSEKWNGNTNKFITNEEFDLTVRCKKDCTHSSQAIYV